MAGAKHDPTEPNHAGASRAREPHAEHLGCRRCLQPLGNAVPSRCPECGLALDPSDPRTVCDLRTRRRRRELLAALAYGIMAGGLLGFGWWFGLVQHNRWLPILNVVAPLVCLGAVPAVLLARLRYARTAIAYALGSMSFVFSATLAIAVDQLLNGVPLAGLSIDFRGTLLVGVPAVALAIAMGIGAGGMLRLVLR